jgi:hypothetical protein
MWEYIEWPPRSPKSAWVFIGAVFALSILGLLAIVIFA